MESFFCPEVVKSFNTLPVAKQFYQGESDDSNLRKYEGKQIWEAFNWQHIYKGQFFDDNLHGLGIYKWINNENYTYEGTFFGGNLDGYGIMSYLDNSVYEGLFKYNNRFGPGVFTYSIGKQDVGLWDGNKIVRLCGILGNTNIPQLVKSQSSQNKLILYRKLISLQEDNVTAKNILHQLTSNETLLEQSDQLYFQSSRHPESIFFNKNKYNHFFQNNEDIYIYIENSILSLEGNSNENTHSHKNSKEIENNYLNIVNSDTELIKKKKLKVTHIISWNNNSIFEAILQHIIFHKKFENILSYNVIDILKGNRITFEEPGHYESMCVMWLKLCYNSKETLSYNYITTNNIHPDVCDCRGNSGIIYASANDNLIMISVLANFGANFDFVNDEGLTALAMSLLRYIAVLENVSNWELAFLPSNVNEDCGEKITKEWFKYFVKPYIFNKNTINLSNITVETQNIHSSNLQEAPQVSNYDNTRKNITSIDDYSNSLSPNLNDISQIYIFNMDHSISEKDIKDKKIVKDKKNNEKLYVDNKEIDKNQECDSLIVNQRIAINNTITALLQKGSCPNFGSVPFPPLILSIFTRNLNIIEEMLLYKADPNIRTLKEQGSLTPLHVLVSLKPSEDLVAILNILLKYGADVHLRTEQNYQDFIKLPPAHSQESYFLGKTPLHILCLRHDLDKDPLNIFGHICTILLCFQTENNLLYLGHTPLTLAILTENIEIIQSMLSTKRVDPNQYINEECGIPLTILLNERFTNILSLDKSITILKTIASHGGNPFVMINDNENGIDFAQRLINKSNDKIDHLEKSNHFKKEDEKDGKNQNHLYENLLLIGKDILERRLKTKALENIFEGIKENISYNELKEMKKFLNIDDTITIINRMIENGKIFKREDVEKVFECVFIKDQINTTIKKENRVKNKKQASKNTEEVVSKDGVQIKNNIDNLLQNITENSGKKSLCFSSFLKLPFPEVDSDDEKYEVCFECCKKNGKKLIKCSLCGFVQFCSNVCYEKSKLRNTVHRFCASIDFSEHQFLNGSKKGSLSNVEKSEDYFGAKVSFVDEKYMNDVKKDELSNTNIIPTTNKKDYKLALQEENIIETIKMQRQKRIPKKGYEKNQKQNVTKDHSKYDYSNKKQKEMVNKNRNDNIKRKKVSRKTGKYKNFIVQVSGSSQQMLTKSSISQNSVDYLTE